MSTDRFVPDLAIVVFSGRANLRWLRFLKPGFRHCFVLMRTSGDWLYYDPMAHYSFVSVVGAYPVLFLLRFFRGLGFQSVLVRPKVPPPEPHRPLPWRPYNCVEAVKRTLGLRAPWVLTPWQLFRLLKSLRRGSGAFA